MEFINARIYFYRYENDRVVAQKGRQPDRFYFIVTGKLLRVKEYHINTGIISKTIGCLTKGMTTDVSHIFNYCNYTIGTRPGRTHTSMLCTCISFGILYKIVINLPRFSMLFVLVQRERNNQIAKESEGIFFFFPILDADHMKATFSNMFILDLK